MEQTTRANGGEFEVSRFLRSRELNTALGVGSASDLFHRLSGLADDADDRGFIEPPDWLSRHSSDPVRLYYRGQTDHRLGVSSSLYRFLRQETTKTITEPMMLAVESAMIEEMRKQRSLGRNLTDGQLLMILQHWGAPTRLVDVSNNPLEALFFACESKDALDGRFFLFSVLDRDSNQAEISMDGRPGEPDRKELPWREAITDSDEVTRGWTRQVSAINATPLDPRMGAQSSAFLVGGVLRNNAGLRATLGKHVLSATELVSVSTLTVGFPKGPVRSSDTVPWNALGWSIRIRASWKKPLMKMLESKEITHDTMYPSFGDIAWKAELAMRRALKDYR